MYIEGLSVDHWVTQHVEWLNNTLIPTPPFLSLWEEFVAHFEQDWADVNAPAKARARLDKLAMKGDELDQYITDFANLAVEAGFSLTDPACLKYFKKGLPTGLLEKCLSLDQPANWPEWCNSARHRQAIWTKLKNYQTNLGQGRKRPSF